MRSIRPRRRRRSARRSGGRRARRRGDGGTLRGALPRRVPGTTTGHGGDHLVCGGLRAHLDGSGFLGESGAEVAPVRGQAFSTHRCRFISEGLCHGIEGNVWRQRPDGRLVDERMAAQGAGTRGGTSGPSVDPSIQNELRSWFEDAFPRPRAASHRARVERSVGMDTGLFFPSWAPSPAARRVGHHGIRAARGSRSRSRPDARLPTRSR